MKNIIKNFEESEKNEYVMANTTVNEVGNSKQITSTHMLKL